ncbi:MAG: hypothetical protein COV71_06410 [Candidatus Omnitrophica bacterium CG11_big_fil_rev_8_21_14_0_20_41_12]|nr:MAG: hypothetical protein COV71_06410 [Candidatus Omnitrophica bacterium CG11_big_fil_rev_8_21_14_0_20_41_12]
MSFQSLRTIIFVLIEFLFLGFSFVYAETIILKSGKKVEGKIVDKRYGHIMIVSQGVPLLYYPQDIESIDGVKLSSPRDAKLEQYISQDEIQFNILGKAANGCYAISALYTGRRDTAAYFGGHYITIYESNLTPIVGFEKELYYDPKNNILFLPLSGKDRRGYYLLGQGEIVNGEFKPHFLKGTKLGYSPSQLHTYLIKIYMPKPANELLVE